ncbi:glycosyltransferase family 4 protein [Microvirga sp. CF3062]|uniref:glycosyltransferase family 4 protein n=1 Tax=Microvirga sp. CF3062 TaxID=3110182 RepID=UPI002E75C720|nr:glycosyltransferase family 4 protein [Microvirga sp. CF3062]MEE1658405.1 glycosyltransferase family 4 protein [Microvirga sp. CF3062]
MHVALVGSHSLPGRSSKGGVQRVVQVLRQELAARARVTLIVPSAPANLRHSDEYGNIIYLKRPPTPGFLSYWSWASFDAYRELARLQPDIVHVHDVAGAALLWPRRKSAPKYPMVFTAHGVLEADILHTAGSNLIRQLTAPARAALVGMIERHARQRFGDVIAINEFVLEAMPDVTAIRHHLIPNPVDDVFLKASQTTCTTSNRFTILQVGVISPLKNIIDSIHIIHALRCQGNDVHLMIIGPVNDANYYRQCRSLIIHLELGSAVTFVGNKQPVDIAAWMDRSDVLLLTSKQEVAPLVVAEAHCRGLPVAAPRAFGLRSMISEGRNGVFLDGAGPKEHAKVLAMLLDSPLNRTLIRSEAIIRYDPKKIADQTVEIYRGALVEYQAALLQAEVVEI